jgi:hypothetical protein
MMVLWGYEVERADIPYYFTPEIEEQLAVFAMYKKFGWPFAGGWAEQAAIVVDICSTLIDEENKRAERDRRSQHTGEH